MAFILAWISQNQKIFTAKGAKYAKENQEFFAYFAPFAVNLCRLFKNVTTLILKIRAIRFC